MEFVNECNCTVDYSILEKSIIEECKRRNIVPKNTYKIYNYRGYAGISLKHDKISVHRIIGKYMVGFDFGSNISVHHIDKTNLIMIFQIFKSSEKICTQRNIILFNMSLKTT